jgi:hypothetical protein
MADKFAPTYALTTRPCTSYAGRYRWVISGNGKPIQTSAEAFKTRRKARANGLVELVKLIKTSRTSLYVLGPLEPRNRRMANVVAPPNLHQCLSRFPTPYSFGDLMWR